MKSKGSEKHSFQLDLLFLEICSITFIPCLILILHTLTKRCNLWKHHTEGTRVEFTGLIEVGSWSDMWVNWRGLWRVWNRTLSRTHPSCLKHVKNCLILFNRSRMSYGFNAQYAYKLSRSKNGCFGIVENEVECTCSYSENITLLNSWKSLYVLFQLIIVLFSNATWYCDVMSKF